MSIISNYIDYKEQIYDLNKQLDMLQKEVFFVTRDKDKEPIFKSIKGFIFKTESDGMKYLEMLVRIYFFNRIDLQNLKTLDNYSQ